MYNKTETIRYRLARLAKRHREIAALSGVLTCEESEFLKPTAGLKRLKAMAAKAHIKSVAAALALVAISTSNAFAGGSGLEVETALKPFVTFFVSFVLPVIGIAALVGAGVAFISGGARAVGNVAVILLGIAFVGFAVPIAASRFGLTQGALIPDALLPGGGLW